MDIGLTVISLRYFVILRLVRETGEAGRSSFQASPLKTTGSLD